jgi:hypothetical protein
MRTELMPCIENAAESEPYSVPQRAGDSGTEAMAPISTKGLGIQVYDGMS